jgi:hypothetical protein
MRDPNDLDTISRRNLLNFAGAGAAALTLASLINIPFAEAKNMLNGADNFYTSDKVDLRTVTFENQYRMKVAGNLFTPKTLDSNARTPAIVVGHPMGAVKEQSANLYATKMVSGCERSLARSMTSMALGRTQGSGGGR